MEREPHVGGLRHRNHAPQEVLEIGPQSLLGGELGLRKGRRLVHRGMVVPGHEGVATRGYRDRRSGPAVDATQL
jgi:hypothetical protein